MNPASNDVYDKGRQERVKTRQGTVNTGSAALDPALTERMTENLSAGIIAIALIAYLVYALVRPDKF